MAQLASQHFYLPLRELASLLKLEDQSLLQRLINLDESPAMLSGRAYLSPNTVRKVLQDAGYNYQLKTLAFQMLKGGVAKTTSALNFGLRAHMYGARVLFLDLDQQANLSFALGIDDLNAPTFLNVLEGKVSLSEAVVEISPGMDLLPANLNNSVIERVLLQGFRNLSQVVKSPLNEIKKNYDLIVIDTAPALSALNTAVTCASDLVILPVSPDKFTLFGLQKHLADLQLVKKEYQLEFQEKVLFTRFDTRESASQVYLQECLQRFPEQMLSSYIRNSADIRNSVASKKTLFESKNYGKEDYDLLTRELMGLWT